MSNNQENQPSEENLEQAATSETPETAAEENAAETPEMSLEEQIASLSQALENAQTDAQTHQDTAIRAKAEAENIRRRSEREVTNASKFALEKFSREILATVDSLEKALELPVEQESQKALHEGIELTYKLLVDTLKKFSVEQISPLGELFDPALHEAMVMADSPEHDANCVMQVVQTGYSLNGRLIRPARVIVAKGNSPEIDQKA